jgi:uncharacterized protein (TIGR02145 family)
MKFHGYNYFHSTRVIVLLIILTCSCEYGSKDIVDYTGQIDSVFDIDGNKYRTIGIGSQIWMGENLKVTRLSDGTGIVTFAEITDWRNQKINKPAYCWYDNDSTNKNIYGGLYNFYAVETGLLCPSGWHVPGQPEWKILVDYLGGQDIAGGKLKDYNGNLWTSPNRCYENSFNFIGLPGGVRRIFEPLSFYSKGLFGCWWTTRLSKESDQRAIQIYVTNESTAITEASGLKKDGVSVRCIKDL